MSLEVFWDDLDELLQVVQVKRQDGYGSREFVEESQRLTELLVDLADYSETIPANQLAIKIRELNDDSDRYHGFNNGDRAQLQTKILRVQRVLKTFGSKHLNKNSPNDALTVADGTDARNSTSSHFLEDPNRKPASNRVFVVHGHDDAILHQVTRLLERLQLKPIVLREQPNKGRTIIEKFESNADVDFAVVLMTADDMGASLDSASEGDYCPRARQNVVLELGYFFARLKRQGTCVLKSQGVETPSDIFGVVYTEIDSAGAWQTILGKELKAAGFDIDLNKL
ncbi:nucleotide-binding protein [Aliiroseovarius sp. S1339]|uniref:TIR domain-containing protein n=1 Tax=Aliiroseovarius sp. S1339 TaxID=2936990 RepID=UPI0020BF019C|nr:nucleotide-binding protein [Aliiroseovarius sp. S1339]MCK8462726.1 nucleotide-binding protein [Aliiroseovarius sp. S1339]